MHLEVLAADGAINMEIRNSNPKIFDLLLSRVKELGSVTGKVGWFESAKYEDGTPVAQVAAHNEFGVMEDKIPPRPTIRPAVIENENKYMDIVTKGSDLVMAGKETAYNVMTKLTLQAQNDIAKNIAKLVSPPLAPLTLEKRKSRGNNSTKPLVDTGLEFATLTSTVNGNVVGVNNAAS